MDRSRQNLQAATSGPSDGSADESVYHHVTYYLGTVKVEPQQRRVTNESGVVTLLSYRQISGLAHLASSYGEFVTRTELHQTVCGVPEGTRHNAALSQHIKKIRVALGDSALQPRFIKTVKGRRNRNYQTTSGGGYYLLLEPQFEAPHRWNDAPYLGLRPFQICHAPIFFGRKAATEEIRGFLQHKAADGCAFVLVTGSGGVGKSSIVQAGVAPSIVRDAGVDCHHAVFRYLDGQGDPFDDLADSIIYAVPDLLDRVNGAEALAHALRSDPNDGHQVLSKLLAPGDTTETDDQHAKRPFKLILILDQLEELLAASATKPEVISLFLALVETLACSGWCYVLATLRSDFLSSALENEVLRRMSIGGGLYPLTVPNMGELRAMVTEPAALTGVSVEVHPAHGDLTDRILEDAAAIESLAVLEFTLAELYVRRDHSNALTFEVYDQLGGLGGCIAKRAETTLTKLSADARASLSSMLTRLVSIRSHEGLDQRIVARPCAWDSIVTSSASRELVGAFVDARLLTVKRGRHDLRIVRVSHEAILTGWKRANDWVLNNQALLVVHGKVARRTREWLASKRADSFLLASGLPLDEGLSLQDSSIHLSDAETDYLNRSVGRDSQARRKRHRLRRATQCAAVAFAALAVIASLLGHAAKKASISAQAEKESAERTTQFMISAFSQATPENTGGTVVTAKDLLDRNVERLHKDVTLTGRQKASLLIATGRAYYSLGEGRTAIPLLETALELVRTDAEASWLERADAMHRLGWALSVFGGDDGANSERTSSRLSDLSRAEELLGSAADIYEKSTVAHDGGLVDALNDLAVVMQDGGNYDKAEQLFRRAINLHQSGVAPSDLALATLKGNLGHLLTLQERLAEAEILLRTSLKLQKGAYGPDDPKLAYSLNKFAAWLYANGDTKEAANHYAQVLQIRSAIFPVGHHAIALAKNNLGKCLTELKEVSRGLALLREAVLEAEAALGPEHPYLGIYNTNLAAALLAAGRATESVASARAALAVFSSNRERTSAWRIAETESILGAALSLTGACKEGGQLMAHGQQILMAEKGAAAQRTKLAVARTETFSQVPGCAG